MQRNSLIWILVLSVSIMFGTFTGLTATASEGSKSRNVLHWAFNGSIPGYGFDPAAAGGSSAQHNVGSVQRPIRGISNQHPEYIFRS